jgi:hypothetical protein
LFACSCRICSVLDLVGVVGLLVVGVVLSVFLVYIFVGGDFVGVRCSHVFAFLSDGLRWGGMLKTRGRLGRAYDSGACEKAAFLQRTSYLASILSLGSCIVSILQLV